MQPLTVRDRFQQNLRELIPERTRVVVASSGGLDSTVLLYLLRFHSHLGDRVAAAHYDHRIRSNSGEDAAWLRGLCRAWNVPFRMERATTPPAGEAAARELRYSFLERARRDLGAQSILTAHHADDQVETVLFRIFRGTGLHGLGGIPASTDRHVLRPLLPFHRSELESLASRTGLRWRHDATNEQDIYTRNRIRNQLLPAIEEVFPGARGNLLRLAELARESEGDWTERVERARALAAQVEDDEVRIDRRAWAGLPDAVASRLLRELIEPFQLALDRAGTRTALEFITHAPSGRTLEPGGDVRFHTEFDTVVIRRAAAQGSPDVQEFLPVLDAGEHWTGAIELGGTAYRVEAFGDAVDRGPEYGAALWAARLDLSRNRFPLTLRARRPGDRIRLPGGSRSLKKLMIDRRIAHSERARRPILADRNDEVIWVAGLEPPDVTDTDTVLNLAIYRG